MYSKTEASSSTARQTPPHFVHCVSHPLENTQLPSSSKDSQRDYSSPIDPTTITFTVRGNSTITISPPSDATAVVNGNSGTRQPSVATPVPAIQEPTIPTATATEHGTRLRLRLREYPKSMVTDTRVISISGGSSLAISLYLPSVAYWRVHGEGLERIPGTVTRGELEELDLVVDRDGVYNVPIFRHCDKLTHRWHRILRILLFIPAFAICLFFSARFGMDSASTLQTTKDLFTVSQSVWSAIKATALGISAALILLVAATSIPFFGGEKIFGPPAKRLDFSDISSLFQNPRNHPTVFAPLTAVTSMGRVAGEEQRSEVHLRV